MPARRNADTPAKRDAVVLGHVVPKGTTVILSSSFQHETERAPAWGRDPQTAAKLAEKRSDNVRKVGYWADGTGKIFDPERWLKKDTGEFDQYAGPSLPFSSGQRGCFGKNLAVSLVLLPGYLSATDCIVVPLRRRGPVYQNG